MSELWTKLSRFNIDAGDELLTFERRLARENGWTPDYSRRVIEEYRRFVFLCCEAGHPCTPSDQVDQAWHLHLSYTCSYWEELCQKVLQRPSTTSPPRVAGGRVPRSTTGTRGRSSRMSGCSARSHQPAGCSDPAAGWLCGALHIPLAVLLLCVLSKPRHQSSHGLDPDDIESGGSDDGMGAGMGVWRRWLWRLWWLRRLWWLKLATSFLFETFFSPPARFLMALKRG